MQQLSVSLAFMQNKVERSLVYAQQQAALHAASAVQIQAVWRGCMARKRCVVMKGVQSERQRYTAAAIIIQASAVALYGSDMVTV